MKGRAAKDDTWKEFVDMCFEPTSPMNTKLKKMMLDMAGKKRKMKI